MHRSDTTWQPLAQPRQGGTVAALAVASGILFAATPAGIRRSTDNGRNWSVAGHPASVPFAEAIAVAPEFERDGTALAGAADGLYRSTDRGGSWRRVLSGRVLSVAAAAQAVWLVGTESDGILRSDDAGQTWTGANAGLLDLTATALAFSPEFERDRTAIAGTTSGLYRTRNGARAWRAAETDVEEPAIQCLAISPAFADDRLVLAGTEADGLLRSDDGGATWHVVSSLSERSVTAVSFEPNGGILVATEAGMALSRDAGQTWHQAPLDAGPVLSLAVVGQTLLAGLAGQGLAASNDGGETWSLQTTELHANLLLALALSPRFADDATMLVGGPQAGVSVSIDAGRTWRDASDGLEDTTVVALASTSQHVFAATSDGLFRAQLAGQPTWRRCCDQPIRALVTRVGAPLFVATDEARLLASEDAGTTWRSLQTPFEGEVVSLALAPEGTLYVGAARPDGQVVLWRSADTGTTWARWLLEQASGGLLPIAVSPRRAADETVWVGVDHRVLHPIRQTREIRAGERRPLWRSVSLGNPSAPVTALAVPNQHTLVAATSAGVLLSRDGGASFRSWNGGLPGLPIVALATSDADVYALALGGTLWRSTIGAGT